MIFLTKGRRCRLVLLGAGGWLAALPGASAGDGDGGAVVAVSSQVSADYVRAKAADGSFQPESYTFGPGGYWPGVARDETIDRLDFKAVARAIAGPLASQRYVSGSDPKTTRFLIMVYWGATGTPGHESESTAYNRLESAQQTLEIARRSGGDVASAEAAVGTALAAVQTENRMRDQVNARTASLLGYDSWWATNQGRENSPLHSRWADMVEELEERRYFVVLMAYDFQLMWKEKKAKLLWETRFSLRERHHDFDRQLTAMAQDAAKYFGRDSHGLVHREPREEKVDLGETKYLGVAPEK